MLDADALQRILMQQQADAHQDRVDFVVFKNVKVHVVGNKHGAVERIIRIYCLHSEKQVLVIVAVVGLQVIGDNAWHKVDIQSKRKHEGNPEEAEGEKQ